MTDIDKLREQGQTSAYMDPDAAFDEAHEAARIEDALATAQRWEGRASALDKALSAALAELVGLRTEVDQLRGENAELRENVVHMESERTGKCLACGEDWTCSGYYADIAHEARIENLITAERDALQAEVEALRRENSVLQHAIDCPPRDVAKQRAIKQVAALQARIDAVTDSLPMLREQIDSYVTDEARGLLLHNLDILVAALGVDPQKETQQ